MTFIMTTVILIQIKKGSSNNPTVVRFSFSFTFPKNPTSYFNLEFKMENLLKVSLLNIF